MNFSKCKRCGCFFTAQNEVCPNCAPKDVLEMKKLESCLTEKKPASLDDICIETGISAKNLNRYLEDEKFAKLLAKQNDSSSGNISINL